MDIDIVQYRYKYKYDIYSMVHIWILHRYEYGYWSGALQYKYYMVQYSINIICYGCRYYMVWIWIQGYIPYQMPTHPFENYKGVGWGCNQKFDLI